MRRIAIGILLALSLSPVTAAAQDESETAAQEPEATDFVIGLYALNRQVIDALEQQPTRRVIILPFSGAEENLDRLTRFITEDLITAVAASRRYELVDPKQLAELVADSGLDPFELGNSPQYLQASHQYANTVIVAGKVTPLGSRFGIMALLLNGENGRTVGGAQVYLRAAQETASLVDTTEPPQTVEEEQGETTGTDSTTGSEDASIPKVDDGSTKPLEKAAAVAPGSLEGRSEQSIYNEAFTDYKAGRYTKAVMLFDYLINRFPESPLADNAMYWSAECDYSRKKWAEALTGFRRLLKEYPFGNKVPDAILKTAYCLERLGSTSEAVTALEDLVSRFGNSPVAELGKRKLQLLRAALQN